MDKLIVNTLQQTIKYQHSAINSSFYSKPAPLVFNLQQIVISCLPSTSVADIDCWDVLHELHLHQNILVSVNLMYLINSITNNFSVRKDFYTNFLFTSSFNFSCFFCNIWNYNRNECQNNIRTKGSPEPVLLTC